MPSFSISNSNILPENLWVSAEFLLLSTGPAKFANWRRIEERLHCDVYFADPYRAWQKGTNENLNGMLREFYPKGRNLSRAAPAALKRNLALINARPHKVLNFHSAQELWDFELNSCCT
ncbi:IS30 family transposase [Pseudoflavonifractor sp. HCP28S3_F10]|uniref:IS30 family transposase n=1 Tax=Pseudoflavonifractor sp. HCP28S3_F10 TaxID=3438947 RepID=UPI003F8B8BB7